MSKIKPAVFLDRDGVINIDKKYVHKIVDFEWIKGSKEAIKFLKEKNYYIFVVTNQSGIARGYYAEDDVISLHLHINDELKKINTSIDEFFYSPYHPINKKLYKELSHLRKPNTGMLELATKNWNIDLSKSFLIGDSKTDMECAKNFGIDGYLFEGGSLLHFVENIINH